jgi:diguanylate cyclase (GGDEF)-like protein/PAS domain S-box-containing protein
MQGIFGRNAEVQSRRKLSAILDAVDDAVLVTDDALRVVVGNAEMGKLLGLDRSQLQGTSLATLLGPKLRKKTGAGVDLTALTSGWAGEVELLLDGASAMPVWLRIAPVDSTRRGGGAVTIVLADLSLLKQATSQALGAQLDPVTGLANRRTIFERIDTVLKQARTAQRNLALLFIGVNRLDLFRAAVEDASADRLLRDVAQRLSHCGFAQDAIGRFADDEFVAILQDLDSTDTIGAAADAVLHALAWRMETEHGAMSVSANIGIAQFPADGDDGEALLRAGHVALQQARASGAGRFEFCQREWPIRASERLSLANRLNNALEHGEFSLWYQPKVDATSHRITGLEALLRLHTPGQPNIGPAEFIPVAEQSGLIVPIGAWVLGRACADCAAWHRAGLPDVAVAVNVSGFQILNGQLLASVQRALRVTGLAPHALEVEITESVMQSSGAAQTLAELRALGVTITLDDFGTGYSSLASLCSLPFDRLKIDRAFVSRLPHDGEFVAITRAILAMSRELDMRVVAEGVETAAQSECLRLIGCDELQGYLFSHPLPAIRIPELLAHDTIAQLR